MSMLILKAYKTELDPNNIQRTLLANHAGAAPLRVFVKGMGVSPATLARFEGGKMVDAITFLRMVEWLRKEVSRDAS